MTKECGSQSITVNADGSMVISVDTRMLPFLTIAQSSIIKRYFNINCGYVILKKCNV